MVRNINGLKVTNKNDGATVVYSNYKSFNLNGRMFVINGYNGVYSYDMRLYSIDVIY